MLAGVGPLQFDVAVDRLKASSASQPRDPTTGTLARRTGSEGAKILRESRHADILDLSDGSFMALFTSEFMLDRFQAQDPGVTLDRMLTR